MGFETCAPSEAIVISGRRNVLHIARLMGAPGMGMSRPKLISGGRAWVWPCFQKVQRCVARQRVIPLTHDSLSLNVHTIVVQSDHIYTKLGVPVSVTGIAQIKIESNNREMLHTACKQFLGRTQAEIEYVALETLEGHQRGILGTGVVRGRWLSGGRHDDGRGDLPGPHQVFRRRVQDRLWRMCGTGGVQRDARQDLCNMGITVVSYTIKDLSDKNGYLLALGAKRTAEVQRDARIGEAQAKQESGIRVRAVVPCRRHTPRRAGGTRHAGEGLRAL